MLWDGKVVIPSRLVRMMEDDGTGGTGHWPLLQGMEIMEKHNKSANLVVNQNTSSLLESKFRYTKCIYPYNLQ